MVPFFVYLRMAADGTRSLDVALLDLRGSSAEVAQVGYHGGGWWKKTDGALGKDQGFHGFHGFHHQYQYQYQYIYI